MFKSRRVGLFLFILSILFLSAYEEGYCLGENEGEYAYVACQDKKIYVIDVGKKCLSKVSRKIEGIGNPTSIDIDAEKSVLYIASERGNWQEKYRPIMKLTIDMSGFDVVKKFDFASNYVDDHFKRIYAVYSIVVSPAGDKLYVLYAHPDYSGSTAVVDSSTGKIINELNFIIDRGTVFSPNGNEVATSWPSGSKKIKNGKEYKIKKWPGGVATFSIKENKKLMQKEIGRDNIGLNPEWKKKKKPFLYMRDSKMLEVYNSATARMVKKINLSSVTNGLISTTKYPVLFDGNNKFIISMVSIKGRGYVVIMDLVESKLIQAIEVGENPTNVILGDISR
jgi:hypothetical protein